MPGAGAVTVAVGEPGGRGASWPLLLQLFATSAMTGLIWFVQMVHYPLFRAVGTSEFVAYEAAHVRLTTFVVGPLMLLESATALWLVTARPDFATPAQAWIGLGLLGVIWASTALLSVPLHDALQLGFDASTHAALVATNWIRTVAWTARCGLLLVLLRAAR